MKRFFDRRFPSYLAGLAISLVAMLLILQAKRAFLPEFHELRENRSRLMLAPGGNIKLAYTRDPGRFLIPGLPSLLLVSKRGPDGNPVSVFRLDYGALVNQDLSIGPFREEGQYELQAELYVCAGPGVADCTKLLLAEPVQVALSAKNHEALLEIDLPSYAQAGLDAAKKKEAR